MLYAPPEVLHNEKFFAPQTEVWSLGILFCILINGSSIFKGSKEIQVFDYNRKAFASMPLGAQQVISLCLEPAPENRISIQGLRRHPYLALDVQKYESVQVRPRNLDT